MSVRPPAEGRAYLRRSSSGQESSLSMQLDYVIAAARQHGIPLQASPEDLEYMQAHRLIRHRDIFLDDAVSGTRTKRPGFDAMIEELVTNANVSHLFVHKRDRFGRPKNPLAMMVVQDQISSAGVTIVTSEGIIAPGTHGAEALAQSLVSYVGFHESGEFSRKLSERIATTQIGLANRGYSTGGIPPYGFGRFLERSDGSLEEIPPFRRVTEPGCHIRFLPNDEEKIKTWIWILEQLEAGWSTKRVAAKLNELGIPTRDAGRTRCDDGVEHEVSGKWHESTVHALATNPIIIGVKEYGRFGEGVHHRLGPEGPRPVVAGELRPDGRGRMVENDTAVRIRATSGGEARFDPDRWHRLQEGLASRGTAQRGKRKAHDPAAYPLTPYVFDLTCGCGGIMHGVTRKDRGAGRPLYRCSIYTKSEGAQCHHNNVDAEALLRFTAKEIVTRLRTCAGRERLRAAVEAKIHQSMKAPPSAEDAIRGEVAARVERLRQKVAQAPKRILEEDDEAMRAALRTGFRELQAELAEAEAALTEVDRRMPRREPPTSVEAEVAKALGLIDRIETVCSDPAAREAFNKLLSDLGVRIGLTFREGRRNGRKVRVLQGGVMAFGNKPLPCTLRNSSGRPIAGGLPAPDEADPQEKHGCDEHDHGLGTAHPGEADRPAGGTKAPSRRKGKSTAPSGTSRGGVLTSAVDSQSSRQLPEAGRLYKASRGDRT
jgi:DNA invertase Pin-like site-specific DNA recombinase